MSVGNKGKGFAKAESQQEQGNQPPKQASHSVISDESQQNYRANSNSLAEQRNANIVHFAERQLNDRNAAVEYVSDVMAYCFDTKGIVEDGSALGLKKLVDAGRTEPWVPSSELVLPAWQSAPVVDSSNLLPASRPQPLSNQSQLTASQDSNK